MTSRPPTEMEERVALAIRDARKSPFEMAKAAIRAMREPTLEMMEAGDTKSGVYPAGITVSRHGDINDLGKIWRAMIDVASPPESGRG